MRQRLVDTLLALIPLAVALALWQALSMFG